MHFHGTVSTDYFCPVIFKIEQYFLLKFNFPNVKCKYKWIKKYDKSSFNKGQLLPL